MSDGGFDNGGGSAVEWRALTTDAAIRLRAIEEYAVSVFGDRASALRWLQRNNRWVRGGVCSVLSACNSTDGFFEAMAELARLSEFRRREAVKRAQLAGSIARPAAPGLQSEAH